VHEAIAGRIRNLGFELDRNPLQHGFDVLTKALIGSFAHDFGNVLADAILRL
jgi:hypothetical protein